VPALSCCPGEELTKVVSQVTAWCARGRHPTRERRRTMRAYMSAAGMAFGLVAVWAALMPFVA
jgi:hypothetical protein